MAYNSGIIFGKPSIADVQQALSDGHDRVNDLCRSANIRTWAKYRPIEPLTANRVTQITDGERAQVNYGIKNIPVWSGGKTIANVVNFWMGINTGTANRPDGYESSLPQEGWWDKSLPTTAFRLTDFVSSVNPDGKGYFCYANPPIGYVDEVGTESSGLVTVIYKMNYEGVSAGLTITYSDLRTMRNISYQNLYFGIIIYAGTTIYLATQDNPVGDMSTDVSTLWSMGAVVRFKIGDTSGDLKTCVQNGTSFQVFPVLTSAKNYVENSVITAIGNNTSGTFVALQEAETVTASITYVQAIILNFTAWRDPSDTSATARRRVHFSFGLKNSDTGTAHYFTVTLTVKDANGNVLNTKSTQTAGYPIAANGTVSSSVIFSEDYIEAGQYYTGATVVEIVVSPAAGDTAAFKKTTSSVTEILPEQSVAT